MTIRSTATVFVLVAALGMAIPSTASAQVGVLVGLNVANVNFDATDSSLSIKGDSRTGLVAGLSFNMPIQDMFSVEVDALFAQKGTKFTATESGFTDSAKIKLNYVDIPVLGRINVNGSAPVGVHLLIGPSFNFKVSEKFDPEDAAEPEDSIEKMETALVFGGGVHAGNVRVDLRYGVGLSDIVKDSASDGFFTGKNRVFSILVGFGS